MPYARELSVDVDDLELVADIDFEVEEGSFAVLTGPNGSGKTTILRALCGKARVCAGDCGFGALSSTGRDVLRRAGASALVDLQPVSDSLTVREHLILIRESWDLTEADGLFETASVTEEFGLGGLLERFPHQLSSGQQQCLHLAMVLGRPATCYLLDEPYRHLDQHRRERLVRSVRARCAGGAPVLAASHGEEFLAGADQLIQL